METEIAIDTGQDAEGFNAAVAAFAEDDTEQGGPPTPVAEAEVAEPPKAEPQKQATESVPEKPSEFVDFSTPEQKKRFNDVFGYAKRLEREKFALEQRLHENQRFVPPQPATPVAPQPVVGFNEPRPKRDEFEGDDGKWVEAVAEWSARKAEHTALVRARQEFSEQQTQRQREDGIRQQQQYESARIFEGQSKYGMDFDTASAEVVNFLTPTMREALFQSKGFPDLVMELGRNLPEADRISRLSPYDQIYELKALERRLSTQQELKKKETQPKPTKVEAPGTGEPPKAEGNVKQLRDRAFKSGKLKDFARYVEEADM